MTELKCPFCGQEAHTTEWESANSEAYCSHCDTTGDLKLWQALIDTKKKLDICIKALNKIANTDIKVIEREPLYYARAMFSVTNNALCRIQDIEQINEIKGGKDE